MTTRRAGVIGWPVAHSKSPRLHGWWLRKYGIDGEYVGVPAPPEAFETKVRELVALDWAGANVTIPHKEAALALSDKASDAARAIGAANTLVFREGRILADNTDAFGFLTNVEECAPGWDRTRPALVIGAGGAARAVLYALAMAGVAEIRLANRTAARARKLAEEIAPGAVVHDWAALDAAMAGAGLIVNTTSMGMEGQAPLTPDFAVAAPGAVAADIVYTPLITPFLAAAAAAGLATVDGLGMLIHQARPGFEAWFGVAPEVDAALRDMLLAA